jgi:hypothetical protein
MKNAISIKFTQQYKDKIKRIKKAPGITKRYIDSMLHELATEYIEIFQDGVRKNKFHLEKLKPATIAAKKIKGYKKPRTPLYGKGDDHNKSLINALLIKKIKDGWSVYARWSKHHEANMQIRQLLYLHENGCIIKRGTTMIRIPPRPALKLAYSKLMRDFNKGQEAKKIKELLTTYIQTGKEFK